MKPLDDRNVEFSGQFVNPERNDGDDVVQKPGARLESGVSIPKVAKDGGVAPEKKRLHPLGRSRLRTPFGGSSPKSPDLMSSNS